jgi:lipoprotein-anchoring transpeptidase ErfK/SrfK
MELRTRPLRALHWPGSALLVLAAAFVVVVGIIAGAARLGEQVAYEQARQSAIVAIAAAGKQLDRDRSLGVDDAELAPLGQSLESAAADQRAATSISAQRAAGAKASAVRDAATRLGDRQAQDDAAVKAAASRLVSGGDDLEAIRKRGQTDLASARNDAVVATWLAEPGIDPVYKALEGYSAPLTSTDRGQVALGAAGAGFYGSRLHGLLLQKMPARTIVISIHDQELTAFENGKAVVQTPVTTGRLPDLATDVGPMHVLGKDSPWKMHSPWPKGSPNWYPDTVVQMVVWFTNTGEGMHDASWQTLPYGPGSETGPDASHGCVHVPLDAEKTLFEWATAGMPVIVLPGDGSPLSAQLQQRTVDADGHPTTGPRGS